MEITENAVSAFEAETGQAPVVPGVDSSTATATAISGKFYTEDDLAKVRSQEKDKLYPVIEQLKEEVSSLRKEKEEKAARKAKEAEEKAAAKAQKEKEDQESELEVRELLKVKEQEWKEQLESERQERQFALAALERERVYADLQGYRMQRIDQERENIIPELVDLINGNTREEIDESIAGLRDRSARILEAVAQQTQSARKEMTGTRATLPPAGPLETNTEQRQLTSQDVASMSMSEYAKYRDRILSETARGKTKGLFG